MLTDWVPLLQSRKLPAVCGLYVIRNKLNGKEYVGKSINVRKRMVAHRQMTSPHAFHRALRKYGLENFEVCILAAGTNDEMLALEIVTIASRGTFGAGGYNATLGGDGAPGTEWTEDMRAVVSRRFKGKLLAAETKKKMSQAATENNPFRGKKHSAEALAKIKASTIERNTGAVFTAERRANMSAALKGRIYTPLSERGRQRLIASASGPNPKKGFKGEKNPMFGVRGSQHPSAKSVLVWSPNSMTPVTFNSGTEAAEALGVSRQTVCDWCRERSTPKDGTAVAYT